VTANRNLTCYNCNTNNTVLWRKGPEGQSPLCNPCGLFYKLHGAHRDPEKKKEIHRRNRAGKKRHSLPSQRRSSWSSESSENEDDETDTADSPVVSHFDFRRHSTASSYGKEGYIKEEMDYSRTMVSPTQEFMTPPYPFQWGQSQSVQGRA
jgi:GATA zinc finger